MAWFTSMCFAFVLLILFQYSSCVTLKEICEQRCHRGRGGVLCHCNAFHFAGKRSGPHFGISSVPRHLKPSHRRAPVSADSTDVSRLFNELFENNDKHHRRRSILGKNIKSIGVASLASKIHPKISHHAVQEMLSRLSPELQTSLIERNGQRGKVAFNLDDIQQMVDLGPESMFDPIRKYTSLVNGNRRRELGAGLMESETNRVGFPGSKNNYGFESVMTENPDERLFEDDDIINKSEHNDNESIGGSDEVDNDRVQTDDNKVDIDMNHLLVDMFHKYKSMEKIQNLEDMDSKLPTSSNKNLKIDMKDSILPTSAELLSDKPSSPDTTARRHPEQSSFSSSYAKQRRSGNTSYLRLRRLEDETKSNRVNRFPAYRNLH